MNAIKQSLKELNIKKPFLVTGKNGFERLKDMLLIPSGIIIGENNGNNGEATGKGIYCVSGEPTVENAREATDQALAGSYDSVICIGMCVVYVHSHMCIFVSISCL